METVYCGVDLHYGKSTFRFLDETGTTKQAVEIRTEKAEIERLLNCYKTNGIAYAFEAGNMATYFHRIVSQMPNTQKIHVVHPYKFKVISESKHKNDKEDSLKLAKGLLKDYLPAPVYIKSEICRQIKFLLNIRRRMVGARAKLILQAKSVLRSLGVKESQRSLTTAKGFARVVGSLANEPFYRQMMETLSTECSMEAKKIEDTEQQIMTLINQNFPQEYELLNTIPGISFVTSATIISVADEIKRFERAGQFSSYCGLVPSEHSSGEKIRHGRITKEGVKELRWLFTQSAWVIIRFKKGRDACMDKMKKKFYRLSCKQKSTAKAVCAIARHLSRIVFGILKNNTPYCGDLTNKAKACCQ